MPVPAMNSAFDALYPPGTQQYWRADFFDSITDDAVLLNVEHGSKMPTPQCTTHMYPVDGVAARVGGDETAWAYRDAKWAQVYFAVDPDPANADALKTWCVDYYEALHPHSMGGGYVNFMMEEGQERVRATYRGHYDRLARIKATYDPGNLFHINQNIKPAGGRRRPGRRAVSRPSAMSRQDRVTARPDGFHRSVQVAVGEAARQIRTGGEPRL